MIRDPSDGSVRDASAAQITAAKPTETVSAKPTPSPDTGLRQPLRTDAQERLERSREWLRDYQERKSAHARGSNEQSEHQADGNSGNDQGETESGLPDGNGADLGTHRQG